MIWFVIGGILGAIQLAISLARRNWESEGPALFITFGAILGAGVYGTILWAIFDLWLEV